MATIVNQLYLALHLMVLGGLVAMLFLPRWRERFARRCVGTAAAVDLAFVRIVTCGILVIYVLTEDLASQAVFGPEWYHWPGYLEPLKRGILRSLVTSETNLQLLTYALLATLVLGMAGALTRLTLPLSAALYLVYGGLLRGFGKYFHEGYLGFYVLLVLCVVACADAWSVDAWWRKKRGRPSAEETFPLSAYGWARWACMAAIVVPYVQLGFSKLAQGGLFWFDGRSLRNYMITDDLNLTEFEIDLAVRLADLPTAFFTAMGLIALVAEVTYVSVLFLPRLRRYLPALIGILHLGVFAWQDALFVDAILIPLIFIQPSRWMKSR